MFSSWECGSSWHFLCPAFICSQISKPGHWVSALNVPSQTGRETFTESGRVQKAASGLMESAELEPVGLSPGFYSRPRAANHLAPQSPLHVICKTGVMKSTFRLLWGEWGDIVKSFRRGLKYLHKWSVRAVISALNLVSQLWLLGFQSSILALYLPPLNPTSVNFCTSSCSAPTQILKPFFFKICF